MAYYPALLLRWLRRRVRRRMRRWLRRWLRRRFRRLRLPDLDTYSLLLLRRRLGRMRLQGQLRKMLNA
jgi:hypothetical protein